MKKGHMRKIANTGIFDPSGHSRVRSFDSPLLARVRARRAGIKQEYKQRDVPIYNPQFLDPADRAAHQRGELKFYEAGKLSMLTDGFMDELAKIAGLPRGFPAAPKTPELKARLRAHKKGRGAAEYMGTPLGDILQEEGMLAGTRRWDYQHQRNAKTQKRPGGDVVERAAGRRWFMRNIGEPDFPDVTPRSIIETAYPESAAAKAIKSRGDRYRHGYLSPTGLSEEGIREQMRPKTLSVREQMKERRMHKRASFVEKTAQAPFKYRDLVLRPPHVWQPPRTLPQKRDDRSLSQRIGEAAGRGARAVMDMPKRITEGMAKLRKGAKRKLGELKAGFKGGFSKKSFLEGFIDELAKIA